MTAYIPAVQKGFIEQHGFPENPHKPGLPMPKEGQDVIPDGTYPMTIDGKLDNVKIIDGKISCCNFEPEDA